ncbi:HAD superfamily hydrolase (TIGR01484 family) [Myceligenerans xiligouense]|uniref:HAD superfamily hydrolase (TIGR01484 family) n=1 Tax=Myceligenerans xiligouense TaxID=253184 RepID=A0A3N4YP43_9MICO|nr:HAD superfamily hydrolase (TIGR01484 family) [Myceligenerans xiligouense]
MSPAMAPQMRAEMLIVLDIDGTLVGKDCKVPVQTVDALELARAAGHHIVPASGRSLAGLIPMARRLGLTEGFAVGSNGAVTVHLDAGMPSGYEVTDTAVFDPGPVIAKAQALEPEVLVAVERLGEGWQVNHRFDAGLLNGPQRVVDASELHGEPTTRVALHAPGLARHTEALAALGGVTVTPAGKNWIDATPADVSKATAVERIRTRLDVPAAATVAVGDDLNDLPLLKWATRGVAMQHAPAVVHDAADETTGSIDAAGVVTVLHSLTPAVARDPGLSPLAAQLTAAVHTTAGSLTSVRVWHSTNTDLAKAEIWTHHTGTWRRHSPIPAARGATMRDMENAAHEAGLDFPRGTPTCSTRGRSSTSTNSCEPTVTSPTP